MSAAAFPGYVSAHLQFSGQNFVYPTHLSLQACHGRHASYLLTVLCGWWEAVLYTASTRAQGKRERWWKKKGGFLFL